MYGSSCGSKQQVVSVLRVEATQLWHQVQQALQANLSKPTFETWIRPAQCTGFANGQLQLLAPNSFACGWLRKNYLGTIEAVASELAGRQVQVQVAVANGDDIHIQPPPAVATPAEAGQPGGAAPAAAKATGEASRKRIPGLNPRYVFNRFVVGPNSRMAHAAALAVAEAPGREFNPLFLCGGVGLGKTHLMHAVGNKMLADNPNARVLYIHAEQFVTDVVKAYQRKTFDEFKSYYHSLDLLLIDDVQFFANKERSQEEFFNAFEALLAKKSHIVMTSDTYPKGLSDIH